MKNQHLKKPKQIRTINHTADNCRILIMLQIATGHSVVNIDVNLKKKPLNLYSISLKKQREN